MGFQGFSRSLSAPDEAERRFGVSWMVSVLP
jgi:hypothetical protein